MNSINYSYRYAIDNYEKLKRYELTSQIPAIADNDCIIIRLDGKGLTSRFKDNEHLFISDFHLAMKRILENIRKYCPEVLFSYSFKDEISLLINEKAISEPYQNRIEKMLPIISGYVSAMFSQFISKKLKRIPTEAFSFDARLIIIPKEQLKDYFHARQAFAMSGFIDRICSFKGLSCSRSLQSVKNELRKNNEDWDSYPQYVCSGYVGFEKDGKWRVETASDFHQKWDKYESTIKDF